MKELTQQKIELIKKIVNARLSKEEMQELLNKAQEIAQRGKPPSK